MIPTAHLARSAHSDADLPRVRPSSRPHQSSAPGAAMRDRSRLTLAASHRWGPVAASRCAGPVWASGPRELIPFLCGTGRAQPRLPFVLLELDTDHGRDLAFAPCAMSWRSHIRRAFFNDRRGGNP